MTGQFLFQFMTHMRIGGRHNNHTDFCFIWTEVNEVIVIYTEPNCNRRHAFSFFSGVHMVKSQMMMGEYKVKWR